ncbi:Scaffold-type E3 ligase [Tulasnella sp. 331]|nr:Scaffold-type E3 ligase [Tulasnella sp. 331]
MITSVVILMPMPFAVRKKVFTFLSTSPIVAKLAYGLKIAFIFIAVLFVDALQRVLRVTAEADLAKQSGMGHNVQTESSNAAKKFYAQRNLYLTTFTLFLSLLHTRIYYFLLDHVHSLDEYAKLKIELTEQKKNSTNAFDKDSVVADLRKQLELKDRDLQALQSQVPSSQAKKDAAIAQFQAVTGASHSDSVKFLKKHNYRVDVAVDQFFSSSNGESVTSQNSQGSSIEKRLNETFDKYKDSHDEIRVDGTIKLAQDLQVELEDVVMLALACELGSTSVGEWPKHGWIAGMKSLHCDSVSALKAQIPSLRQKLSTDPDYFRRVYTHTFAFGLEKGQRSLPLESAVLFWSLLLPIGLSGGALSHLANESTSGAPEGGWRKEHTQWWFDYLQEKNVKGVSKDTWSMFLDFVRTVDDKFEKHDNEGSWPSQIDDFAAHAKKKAAVERYAFIEYKNERDADEAYHSMHGRHFDGYRLSVQSSSTKTITETQAPQWAKNPPSSIWRFEKKGGAPQEGSHRDRHRSRSRSPRRERRSTREDGYRRKRSPSPEEDRPNRDRNRESSVDGRGQRDSRGEYRDDKARRSRSPAARRGPPEERRRARTPNPPGSHTPPPSDYAARKDDRIDSALTPPYD